jgi:hypothetical protein
MALQNSFPDTVVPLVARIERNEIRDCRSTNRNTGGWREADPDFASLNPGYSRYSRVSLHPCEREDISTAAIGIF